MIIDFRFSRFLLLLRKFIRENRKIYILYLSGFFGLLLLIYGLFVFMAFHSPFPREIQKVLFSVGLLLGGSFYSASFYSFFSNSAKGIQFLQLPVSNSEKLLLSFLFTQVVYFVSFMLIFICVDNMLCAFYNHFVSIPDWVGPLQKEWYKAEVLNLKDEHNQMPILMYFILSSIAHFGSVSFTKHAFVKTAIAFIIIASAITLYNQYSLIGLLSSITIMPHGMFLNDSFRIDSTINKGDLVINSESWVLTMYIIMPILIYISCWTGSYFKLKEKQA